MADIASKIHEIYSLEQLSAGKTAVHRLHPGAKLLVTAVYIVCVVSFDRYALSRLLPYIFYPVLLMALGEIPWGIVLRRVLLALPFVVFAGVTNVIFDREAALLLFGITVSQGVISCLSIVFRTVLTVSSILILVAVTPFPSLTSQLRRVHIPEVLVMLFEMTYRYIGTLLQEASDMYVAYGLRHTHHKGLEMKHMGSFVGCLLLRSFDRAERVYAAMKCRGYGRAGFRHHTHGWKGSDYLFALGVSALLVLPRFFDLPAIFTQWIGRYLL